MLEAGFWGFVGGAALLLGALIGLKVRTGQRTIGLIMAFGAGVLISALAFELTAESFRRGGTATVAAGLAAGGILFFAGDWIIDHRGGDNRKRSGGEQEGGSGSAIVLGALMDGIPESVAIGVSLLGGGGVGVATVAAVFLSNVPEGLSSAAGMRQAGRSSAYVFGVWTAIAVISGVASLVGYAVFSRFSADVIAATTAVAAGAILSMLADTMMPEAFEEAHDWAGLITVAGFLAAFVLTKLSA
jgi:ZIP family zinc transporter